MQIVFSSHRPCREGIMASPTSNSVAYVTPPSSCQLQGRCSSISFHDCLLVSWEDKWTEKINFISLRAFLGSYKHYLCLQSLAKNLPQSMPSCKGDWETVNSGWPCVKPNVGSVLLRRMNIKGQLVVYRHRTVSSRDQSPPILSHCVLRTFAEK